jgi:hypothetical protein
MKHTLLFLTAVIIALTAACAPTGDGWISMFDGKTLSGWKSNDETPGCFSVEDGKLKVSGGRAHLFYVGADGKAAFKNFEFKAKVMTTPGSNSGIYFHTAFQEKGWPEKGFECQVNTTHKDPKKTGGLYAILDVMNNAPSQDNEWFDYEIKVEGKHVVVKINGKVTADWTEPADWQPPAKMPGRRLAEGAICLQGHDPKSTVYYKDLAIKPLP